LAGSSLTGLRPPETVAEDVRRALAEDIGDGDLTAALLEPGAGLRTRVISREAAVFCGRPWFDETFRALAEQEQAVQIHWSVADGDALEPDQELCRLEGDARCILSGERTALNFIQTLSATATQTRAFVERLEGSGTRLLDTRKTLPGLRRAQKYAVLCGGGHNHRMGLYDAVMIKENHIAAAGTITRAVATARRQAPSVLVEVEVETLAELAEACAAGADRALLDHFDEDQLRMAVRDHGSEIELEASGDVTLETVAAIAGTGVDFVSTGAVTKHVRAVDFSMRFF
jgi:nicotinate-nucleotide pyrophosphorylase (carboxylating)